MKTIFFNAVIFSTISFATMQSAHNSIASYYPYDPIYGQSQPEQHNTHILGRYLGRQSFFFAIATGDSDKILATLNAENANSTIGESKWTPLHIAVLFKQRTIATILVELGGAALNAKTGEGHTPLDFVDPIDTELSAMLIGHGAIKRQELVLLNSHIRNENMNYERTREQINKERLSKWRTEASQSSVVVITPQQCSTVHGKKNRCCCIQ